MKALAVWSIVVAAAPAAAQNQGGALSAAYAKLQAANSLEATMTISLPGVRPKIGKSNSSSQTYTKSSPRTSNTDQTGKPCPSIGH